MYEWRPHHAYIPGKTPRHPEDLFDEIKAAAEKTPIDQMSRCETMIYGLAFLQDGFYWEAHEVLEAVWMACPPNSAEKLMVQAVIQTANARLKDVMGNPSASARLQSEAKRLAKEAELRKGGPVFGINIDNLHYNA